MVSLVKSSNRYADAEQSPAVRARAESLGLTSTMIDDCDV
jgi:hypothetical protein